MPVVFTEPAVCLLDSDPAVRDSVHALVGLHGQSIRCYSTARGFLDEVLRIPVRCVICEARLPDQRGIDVYLDLLDRGYRLPFALLVSRDLERVRSEAALCGISLVIAKPIQSATPLIEFINQHLQSAQGKQGER
jgi:FixJ family two-component response regulator